MREFFLYSYILPCLKIQILFISIETAKFVVVSNFTNNFSLVNMFNMTMRKANRESPNTSELFLLYMTIEFWSSIFSKKQSSALLSPLV